MTPSTHSHKRRRSTSSGDSLSLRSVETLFSKQLMRVVGILFLAGSLWFAANSTDTIFKVAKSLVSPKELIVKQPAGLSASGGESHTESPAPTPPVTLPAVLSVVGLLAGWLGLQWLTRWRKRAEFQVISVFLVFIVLLAMIRSFGWQVGLYFPMLVLVSAGLYLFGHHLSHNGMRIHFFFTWGIFSLWWLLKLMINGAREQLPGFFVLSSLIFLSFHIIQLFHGFAGHKRLSNIIEVVAIAGNLAVYFILTAATLLKFYGRPPIFLLTLILTAAYFLSLLAMEYFRKPFRKAPFLSSLMVLASLLLPLLFWGNKMILLTGSISLLSLFYSRQTKDQPSIIVGLILAGLMVLVFLKELVFSYVPAAYSGALAGNPDLFHRGMISGLFLALVGFLDRIMLRKMEISFSRKWFERKRYLMMLKGVFLAGLYFGLFFLFQYPVLRVVGFNEVSLYSWFTYHCLFSIISIPWLATQRSSSLPSVIILSVILTFIFPSLLGLQTEQMLNLFVRQEPAGLTVFPLHYIPSVLFLGYLSVVLTYAGKAFKGGTVAKRIFLIYAVLMVIYILVSEMVVTVAAAEAVSQLESNEIQQRLLRLPASLILFMSGFVIMVWGFIRRKRFGRTLALIILLLAAFKLIYYDIRSLSMITRVLLLFITGSLFIIISLVYRMARKAAHKHKPHSHRHAPLQPSGTEEVREQPTHDETS